MSRTTPTCAFIRVRSGAPVAWYGGIRGAESSLTALLGATEYRLHHPPRGGTAHRVARRALTTLGRYSTTIEPGLTRPADVGFVWASDFADLGALLHADPAWIEFANHRVLVLHEVWPGELAMQSERFHDLLRTFHLVCITTEHSGMQALAGDGVEVVYMPGGVHTAAFTPFPPERPITVMNYGRRDRAQHAALASWAEAGSHWYHYDTAGLGPTPDPLEHHHALGRLVGASTFSVCNMARFDDLERTGGNEEIGDRFYEALAAGCLLVGMLPRSPAFEEVFAELPGLISWPAGGGRDALGELDRWLADPAALDAASRRHRAEALRHHDFVHRIVDMLDRLDIAPPAALTDRATALKAEADHLVGVHPSREGKHPPWNSRSSSPQPFDGGG